MSRASYMYIAAWDWNRHLMNQFDITDVTHEIAHASIVHKCNFVC